MSDTASSTPQNDETIAYLEEALDAARSGRLLFFVGSFGAVSKVSKTPQLGTFPATVEQASGPSDQIAPRLFEVKAGVFSTETAAHLHPASRSGALSDTLRGAVGAMQSIAGADPVAATPPAKKLVSLE